MGALIFVRYSISEAAIRNFVSRVGWSGPVFVVDNNTGSPLNFHGGGQRFFCILGSNSRREFSGFVEGLEQGLSNGYDRFYCFNDTVVTNKEFRKCRKVISHQRFLGFSTPVLVGFRDKSFYFDCDHQLLCRTWHIRSDCFVTNSSGAGLIAGVVRGSSIETVRSDTLFHEIINEFGLKFMPEKYDEAKMLAIFTELSLSASFCATGLVFSLDSFEVAVSNFFKKLSTRVHIFVRKVL